MSASTLYRNLHFKQRCKPGAWSANSLTLAGPLVQRERRIGLGIQTVQAVEQLGVCLRAEPPALGHKRCRRRAASGGRRRRCVRLYRAVAALPACMVLLRQRAGQGGRQQFELAVLRVADHLGPRRLLHGCLAAITARLEAWEAS